MSDDLQEQGHGNASDAEAIIRAATGAPSLRAIALRIGMLPPTLGRQLRGTVPVATTAAIARAYQLDVIDLFVQIGYLTVEEARSRPLPDGGLDWVSDEQLAEEVLRRMADDHPSAS